MDRVKLREIVTREGMEAVPNDDRRTQFAKLRKKTGGRAKGTPNKSSAEMKAIMLAAMDMVGSDGQGTDGAIGYLAMIAWENRDIFGRMIEKLLPFVLTGKDGGPVQLQYSNKADVVQRMKERGLPIPKSLMLSYDPRKPDETEQ
jgi:hypothetical protein